MILVTGGSGFVGTHVVRALLDRGETIRCLVRDDRPRVNLQDLPIETVRGDLSTGKGLQAAVQGCQAVYHVAADYRLWARDPDELYRTNVDGTLALLKAAGAAGVNRVVYTSSVGTLGIGKNGEPATESTPVSAADMIGHYKRSKFLAEEAVRQLATEGLPVVIVNPSTPVGERDVKPTPTGKIILDFLRRKMPAYVDTGLNFVDVQDVARGHLLAHDRGEIGERYILGGIDLTLHQLLTRLATLTGYRAPRVRLPHWVPLMVGTVEAGLGRLTGREPRVPLEGARMARKRMWFSSAHAARELGYTPGPLDPALTRAIAWFRSEGYAR